MAGPGHMGFDVTWYGIHGNIGAQVEWPSSYSVGGIKKTPRNAMRHLVNTHEGGREARPEEAEGCIQTQVMGERERWLQAVERDSLLNGSREAARPGIRREQAGGEYYQAVGGPHKPQSEQPGSLLGPILHLHLPCISVPCL